MQACSGLPVAVVTLKLSPPESRRQTRKTRTRKDTADFNEFTQASSLSVFLELLLVHGSEQLH